MFNYFYLISLQIIYFTHYLLNNLFFMNFNKKLFKFYKKNKFYLYILILIHFY